MERRDYISASEIGEFVYCRRAYWLAQQGEARTVSRAMTQGSAAHKQLNDQVEEVTHKEERSSVGLVAALVLLALAGLFWIVLL